MRIKIDSIADIKARYSLMTQEEVAERCNIGGQKLRDLIRAGKIPKPSTYIGEGRRAYYTEAEAERIGEYLESKNALLTRTEVAERSGVYPQDLDKAVRNGDIPKATQRLEGGKRRYYTAEEAERIKEYFENREPIRVEDYLYHYKRREAGLLSKTDVCERAGIARPTIDWHIKRNRIKAPARRYGNVGRYYSEEEAEEILQFFEKTKDSACREFGRRRRQANGG